MKLEITRESFLEAIRQGLSIERACILTGIAEKTFYNWRDKAKTQTSGKYYSFLQDIKKAEAQAISSKLEAIQKAIAGGFEVVDIEETFNAKGELIRKVVKTHRAPPCWQASAWYLERKLPAEWGRKAALPILDDKPKEALTIHIVKDTKASNASNEGNKIG